MARARLSNGYWGVGMVNILHRYGLAAVGA